MDKHAVGLYATNPPTAGYRWERPQAEVDAVAGRPAAGDYLGEASIETWTVMHDREGLATRGHAACLTPQGERAWAVTSQPELMAAMTSEALLGRAVQIAAEGELQFL